MFLRILKLARASVCRRANTLVLPRSMKMQARTLAMRSNYNNHSEYQGAVFATARDYIKQGVDFHSAEMPHPNNPTTNGFITIADYGCATGANSSMAMSFVIERLRAKYGRAEARYVQVIHSDLPTNDWATMFDHIHTHSNSYLKKHDGVFALGSGLSFYHQSLPPNSLHFGFSNCALHWLSKVPVKIANNCFVPYGTKREQEAFRETAAQDLRNFLSARAVELVNGGVLVLNFVARLQATSFKMDTVYQSAKKLFERGLLSEEELRNFNVPKHYRNLAEITDQAMMDELGLQILTAEEVSVPHPLGLAYLEHQDVDRLSSEYTDFLASAVDDVFTSALHPSQDRQLLSDLLWREYRQFVKKQPAAFGLPTGHLFLILRKN